MLTILSGFCSSSRSCRRGWDPASPLAERGAHDAPHLALGPRGLPGHARTLSPLARENQPPRASPLHRDPARLRA